MLLALAWLLWLYYQPHQDSEDEHEDCKESETTVVLADLPYGHSKKIVEDEERIKAVVEDEVMQAEVHDALQEVDFFDWDAMKNVNEAKEALLLKQQSIQPDAGSNACVVDAEEIAPTDFVTVEQPYTETRTANIVSQPSIKRDRGKIFSQNSSFTPIDKKSDEHSISSLSIDVHNDSSKTPNKVSVYEGTLKPSPVKIHFGSNLFEEEDLLEDNEVAQAFENGNEPEEEEEDMQYTLPHGTKVTISHEAAGRIHSIVVHEKKEQPKKKPSKIRIASPRMRATSPRVRAENVSPTIISMSQPRSNVDDDLVHLVVNTSQMDVNASSREHVVVEEDIIASPMSVNMVESGNPDFNHFKTGKGKKPDVGKLPPHQVKRKDPNLLEKQTRAVTDFDTIMNKRKKFVDTMDDAGRLLGQIAHRDEKLAGGRRELSKHWLKIKDAVLRRQYLNFKDRPMR